MKSTIENVNQIEATIDAALEHASFAWIALEKETSVNRVEPDSWPPKVESKVGTAQYHFSAMIGAVHRAYQIIRAEQDRLNGIESPNTEG